MRNFGISASLICCDVLNIEKEIKSLENAMVDYIHFDVMDGNFVPRYGLFPEIASQIAKKTNLQIEVHMMVSNPEPYIETFAKAGVKIFSVHVESSPHIHRILHKIKDAGMKSGIVLNISTPIEVIDYIIDDIDYIMLMGINPGIVGHKIIPKIYDKISDVRKKTKGTNIKIIIDGGVSFESTPKMILSGADILVCGSSTIFNQGLPLEEAVRRYEESVGKFFK